jgi:hypothetical protein
MRFIIYLTILLISLPALAQFAEGLHNQLIKMAQQNQHIHQSLDKYAPENLPPALQSVASEIDNLHTQTLKEIVSLHGWPTKKQVGIQGIQAAFILLKYSHDLVFQQDMLPLVIQSYLDKEGIAGKDVAEFTDKVSIKLGKKQVFGTQAEFIDGKVIFAAIENPSSVDPLRAQMGMSSLAEYKTTLALLYGLQKHH